jgi:hypothetical protein
MTRVLFDKITDEFILRPDVVWVHDAFVDLEHCSSFLYMKSNSKVVAAVWQSCVCAAGRPPGSNE